MLIGSTTSGLLGSAHANSNHVRDRYLVYYDDKPVNGNTISRAMLNLGADDSNNLGDVISDHVSVIVDTPNNITSQLSHKQIRAIEKDHAVTLSQDYNIESATTTPAAITTTGASIALLPKTINDYTSEIRGKGIKIAIVDSGVNTDGTGINLAGGISFIDDVNYNSDENGHGTALAGLIKGYQSADGKSFPGIAPESELYSVKILTSTGTGYYSDVIRALDWSRKNNIDIVLMPFGANQYSAILHRSVQQAYLQDMLLIGAAGNGDNAVQYPAAYKEVMAVGASHITKAEQLAIPYQYPDKEKVEIYTAGVGIESVKPDNTLSTGNGTSYSSALIAGEAAKLWSQAKTRNAREIRGLIRYSAYDFKAHPILDNKRAQAYLEAGKIPTAKDYLAQIKDTGSPNALVGTLAEFDGDYSQFKIWESVILNVKFSHNHALVEAILYNVETNNVTKTIHVTDVKGAHDGTSYTEDPVKFDFGNVPRGKYIVKFDPSREEIKDPALNIKFESDEFEVLGADLEVNKFEIVNTKDAILGTETLKFEVTIKNNYELAHSTDYPKSVTLNTYLIPDTADEYLNPYNIDFKKMKDTDLAEKGIIKLDSQTYTASEINDKKTIVQPLSWTPTSKTSAKAYKGIAIIDSNIPEDDDYGFKLEASNPRKTNNKKSLDSMSNVSFKLPNGQLWQVMVADPVDVATGNYHSNVTDLAVAGKAPISFERYYNAQDYKERGYGLHWRHKYDMYVEQYDDYTKVYLENGSVEFFHHESGQLKFNPSKYNNVSYNSAGELVLEFKNHQTYTFYHKKDNTFIKTIEEKGNLTHFHYTPFFDSVKHEDSVRLVKVSSVSGEININYTPDYHYITDITDGGGRKVSYSYNGRYLISTTNVSGNTYQYVYNERSLLTKIIDPKGHTQLLNSYDPESRVVAQVNEDGTKTTFQYFEDKTIFTRRDGQTETYHKDDLGRITKRDYPEGSERYVFDENNNLIRHIDKNGNETQYSYDSAGNKTSMTNALGESTTYSYTTSGDIETIKTPDGSITTLSYDDKGRVVGTTDALGQTSTMLYDTAGNLTRLTRKDGSILSFTYDSRGNLLTESIGSDLLKSYTYDDVNRLVSTKNPKGDITALSYLPNGKVARVTLADGSTTQNSYDNESRLISQTDAKGNITRYDYNDMGSLIKMTTPDGAVTTYQYDNMQNLVSTTFADGSVVTNTYDSANRIVKVVDEVGGVSTVSYDANGNVLTSTNQNAQTITMTYDKLNRLVTTTNPLGETTTISYRYDNQVTKVVDGAGKTTTYDYDALGRLLKVTTPDGENVQYTYSPLDKMQTFSDVAGRITRYTYDAQSRLIAVTRPDGAVLKNGYDANGNIISSTDAKGNSNQYAYDIKNRLIEKTNPLGDSVKISYDQNDNIIKIINENDTPTTLSYDAMNRVTTVKDALGQDVRTQYDILGRIVKVIGKDSTFKAFNYDEKGRLITTTDEENATTTYSYDGVGNILTIKDPVGAITTSTYDVLNRISKTTDPLGAVTAFSYDQSSNISAVTDALGGTTRYSYDEMNRTLTETSAIGALKTFSYDNLSNLTQYKDPKGNITQYSYDVLNRLAVVTFSDGATHTQAYDKNSNIVSVKDALSHETRYTYDALNRLIKTIDAEGGEQSLSYTKTSKVKAHTDAKGNTTSYSYDVLDRLVKNTNALGHEVTLSYDAVDNLVKTHQLKGLTQQMLNGLADKTGFSTDMQVIEETFSYNKRGQLTKEVGALGHATTYQYDPRGLLIGKVDEDKVETQFSYDLNRNLIETKIINQPLAGAEGSTINYAYDALGRLTKRLDSLYSIYHGGSESPKTYTYSYDIVGRLLSETDYEGKTTRFSYDFNNNITEMVYPDDVTRVAYRYDNRDRIKEVEDEDGISKYSYDKNGRRLRLDFANGSHEKYAYDKKGRTLSQVTGDKTNTTMTIHDYEYDKNDNIVVDTFKNFKTALIKDVIVKTYAYDALNQLTIDKERQDCYEGYGTQNNYYYDSMGN